MADIKQVIDELLKEPIAHHICDSGGAYGYQYEKNQEQGYLTGFSPVDEYTNEETNERELIITIPLFDFLTYNLIRDEDAVEVEKRLFNVLTERDINYYHIFEVQEVIEELFEEGLLKLEYVNTYNMVEYISQTIQFCPFENEGEEYLILQIHNGCDVRSGYTKPMVFKLKDIEYFWLGLSDCCCECECGFNDYHFCGEDDATDSCGDYVHKDEIYKRTYVDANGNVCCCECDGIIKGGFVEW